MTPTARSGGGSGAGDDSGDEGGARIQVSAHADCVVVTISGEVDLRTTARFSRTLEAAAMASPTAGVIIDMTDLGFIDSAGLGVLIHAQNRAEARGAAVVLVNPPSLVRRLLAGTQLQHRFTAYDRLDDALAALRPR